MNKLVKSIADKDPKQLGVFVMKLKLQLLENRFAFASGDIEKSKKNKEIKHLIAIAETMLRQKGFNITIGNHGVALHNVKDNTTTYINKEVSEELASKLAKVEEEASEKKLKNLAKMVEEVKKGEEDKHVNLNNLNDNINMGQMSNIKNRAKNVEKSIRKTQGGGK